MLVSPMDAPLMNGEAKLWDVVKKEEQFAVERRGFQDSTRAASDVPGGRAA